MNLKALFIPLVLSLVFSCKNNREEEVKKVDELIVLLEHTENKFNEIDSIGLFSVYTKMITDLKDVHYFTDTLDSETFDKITNAYHHLSTFTAATQSFPILKSELIHSKKQLNNLKQDAGFGLIETAKFYAIYKEEQGILLNLNDVLDSTFADINSKLIETENNYPTVDSIVLHFKQLKENNTVNE